MESRLTYGTYKNSFAVGTWRCRLIQKIITSFSFIPTLQVVEVSYCEIFNSEHLALVVADSVRTSYESDNIEKQLQDASSVRTTSAIHNLHLKSQGFIHHKHEGKHL